MSAEGAGAGVTLGVRQTDSLAAALDSLLVRVPERVPALDETGRMLPGRLTYLLEPLALLEIGADSALLRSVPPRVHDAGADYYELWLRVDEEGTSAEMRRYRARRQERRREALPMTFTWELIERLLDDLYTTLRV